MKKRFGKVVLIFLCVIIFFPVFVFAETKEEIENVFDGESENSEDSELDGFISGDTAYESEKEKTVHVIIENGNTSENEENNSEIADPGVNSITDNGDSYGGSESSSTSLAGSSGEKIMHKPQILLEESNLSGQSLEAGTVMEMSVTFRNKSRSQNIYGLKIAVSTETKGIEFEKNSFYVQRLTPGEAITLKQKMNLSESCEPGQAVLSFSLDYEDSKATGVTGDEMLTFEIVQPVRARLEITAIPSAFYTMDTVEIPVKVLNLGKDKLYNASVQLSAEGLNPKETVFLGTVEAGTAAEGNMQAYVKGKESGQSTENTVSGTFLLTYEDAKGHTYEEKTGFDSELKESQIQSLKVEEDQEETNGWQYSIFTVVLIFLVSVILFLLAKLHKKSVLLEETRKADLY